MFERIVVCGDGMVIWFNEIHYLDSLKIQQFLLQKEHVHELEFR